MAPKSCELDANSLKSKSKAQTGTEIVRSSRELVQIGKYWFGLRTKSRESDAYSLKFTNKAKGVAGETGTEIVTN